MLFNYDSLIMNMNEVDVARIFKSNILNFFTKYFSNLFGMNKQNWYKFKKITWDKYKYNKVCIKLCIKIEEHIIKN